MWFGSVQQWKEPSYRRRLQLKPTGYLTANILPMLRGRAIGIDVQLLTPQ